MINCHYDESQPDKYNVTVLDKKIEKGKNSTTYSLTISPWKSDSVQSKVSVSRDFYERTNQHDEIHVYQQSGLLGIPWFYLGK